MVSPYSVDGYNQGDEDLDPNDEDDTSYRVKTSSSIESPYAAPGALDSLNAMRDQERQGLKALFEQQRQMLMAQRVGPSTRERISEALLAFGQPTHSGKFGEALSNAGTNLMESARAGRTAQDARADELRKLALQEATQEYGLAAKYGLEGFKAKSALELQTLKNAGKAAAGVKPLKITQGVAPAGAWVITTMPDLSTQFHWIKDGVAGPPMAVPSDIDPNSGKEVDPNSVPSVPTAPSTAAPSAASPTSRPRVKGADGITREQQFDGTWVVVETPDPNFKAAEAGGVKRAEKGAEADVARQGDKLEKSDAARASNETLKTSEAMLASGKVITGFGANQKLAVLRAQAAAGDKDAAEKVAATETLQINAAQQVLSIIKTFGSGTAISDADREYANKMVGGQITLNEQTLKNIIAILRRQNARAQAESRKAGTPGQAPSKGGRMHYDASGKLVRD